MQEDETALVSSRDLRCVICYELFEWPITLFCGHTFCRTCISLSWAAQRQAPGHCCYTCPVCRKEYPRKRKLTKTVVLANMVEEVRKRRKAPRSEGCGGAAGGGGGGGGGGAGDCNGADQGGVSCKSCLGEDALAVKTCLRCESPLCEAHVRRHGLDPAFSDHELAPLSVNTAARRCKEHRATLKYYCTQDGLLVCSDCCLFGTHKDHQLVAARDEYEERKLLVTIEKERRVDRKKSSEAKILELSDYHNRVEKYTDEMKTRVHAFYALNRPLLDDEEEEIMHGLDAQCGPALYMAQHNIQLHQREIHSLGCLIARLDALLDTDDPITFLQDPVLNELTSLPTTVDITGEPFPSMDVHQTISLQKIMGTRPLPLIAERYGCSPTLDPATASPWLRVSRDLRTVMGSPPRQPPPDHPARFDCWHPQVLGACPLSSGRHYWEVDVGGAGSWRVGVAYGSIPRKGQGNVCKLGENSQSWCLFMDNGELTARHGGVGTLLRPQTEAAAPAAPASGLPVGSLVLSPAVGAPVASSAGTSSEPPAAQPSTPPTAQPTGPSSSSPLSAAGGNPSGPPPRRVGVLLDCDAGTVGFYRADDSTALLHSFAAKFAQPLYPALAVLVWDGSLTMVELE